MFERLKPTYEVRRNFLPGSKELAEQIDATKHLVDVLNSRLDSVDKPGTYLVFLSTRIEGENLLLKILAIKNENGDDKGLFLYIYKDKDKTGYEEIIGLQTAQKVGAVEKDEAEWLSCYSPGQLDIISDIVRNAKIVPKG